MDDPDRPLTPEDLRRWGRRLVDWIADYHERIESFPVLSQVEPGEIRGALPPSPPEEGEPFEEILADVERIILPGVTHWQSPSFFAYFPANASPPAILGELLSAGLGVQGMLWATSPACTELETHVCDWLVEALGLPEHFRSSGSGGGVIQDTASSATLCALLAARERATELASNERGVPPGLRAYTSAEAHSSVEKAVRIAGLGRDALRLIPVDDEHAMRPEALAEAMDRDVARGETPCFVCATVGTTSSQAMDPLAEIGALCRDRGVWLHVDAAMAGTAALCPEHRHLQAGVELADSYSFNPHKWMLTNFDCSCFWVKQRRELVDALSVLPEYLRNRPSESGEVIDYRDWQIPLGRRFRALKLWFVLRTYGLEDLRSMVRRHVELAQRFAGWVEGSEDFELAAPVPLNLVCFRHLRGEEAGRRLMERLNSSGDLYLTHTVLRQRFTLRLSIGQARTEEEHVRRAWERIREEGRRV